MNILDIIMLVLGIVICILILIYFIIIEIKSNTFSRLGFVDKKEELYNISFEKFDFDYKSSSGIDNNESQEDLISTAIEKINTQDNPTIKEIDYYA